MYVWLQWFQSLFRCRIELLNFSTGFKTHRMREPGSDGNLYVMFFKKNQIICLMTLLTNFEEGQTFKITWKLLEKMTDTFPHIPDFAWISHALPRNIIAPYMDMLHINRSLHYWLVLVVKMKIHENVIVDGMTRIVAQKKKKVFKVREDIITMFFHF